jgi:DNA-binding transcriptional LysR family regulator
MRPQFDIEALRTIIAASELGSFSRAAIQLGRSQSAVSMQLKRLEEQAGQSLFQRSGRYLIPTEAGDTLLASARKIVAIHDEAAFLLGQSPSVAPSIRFGLPQDFFEDVMPDALAVFALSQPDTHVEVRAGRNYLLEDEVNAGRLDVAIAFSQPGRNHSGERLAAMQTFWFGNHDSSADDANRPKPLPLVLFNHPCLFRQAALQSLDDAATRWRLALTTPSLSGVWAAIRFGLGVTVRTAHGVPPGIIRIEGRLPKLSSLELRLLTGNNLSSAASEFVDVLRNTCLKHLDGLP